jgi:CHAD domain-containing protein
VPVTRNELELKYIAPLDLQLPPLPPGTTGVAELRELAPLDLGATYFDDEALSLLSLGITLRYRTGEGEEPLWTLKLPAGGDDASRSEIELPGTAEGPPEEIQSLLQGVLAGSMITPIAEIRTRRLRWSLIGADGSELAQLVDDRVFVLDGNSIRDRFREIEVEATSATRAQLERIGEVIEEAGARNEQRSKLSRAVEALRGSLPPKFGSTEVGPNEPADAAVRPAIAAGLRRLLVNDPYARLGEVEGVHQLRVATRRLRSVFRTFSPLIREERVAEVIDELRWLGRALGAVRDLDVLRDNLQAQSRGSGTVLEPLFAELAQRHAAATEVLQKDLRSERYTNLLRRLADLTRDEELTVPQVAECAIVIPRLIERTWRRLRKPARRLEPDSPETEFHRVRILAKRARYAAETGASFVDPRTARQLKDFAAGAEAVQNILGEHQDAAVARETVTHLAVQHPHNGQLNFWLGKLAGTQEAIAARKRDEFFDEWERLDRKRNLRWSR